MVKTNLLSGIRIPMQYFAEKPDDDKKPDEEKSKYEAETPNEEKKSEPKADEPKDEKTDDVKPDEKKETSEPKSDEEGKEEKKPDEESDNKKSEESPEAEPKEETDNNSPDEKDEEILRLKTQIAAMTLGVSADCMEDAVAIAESYVKSGKAGDINAALQAVVKKYPDMKAEGKDEKSKGFKVGAGSPEQKSADDDRLNEAFGLKKKKRKD